MAFPHYRDYDTPRQYTFSTSDSLSTSNTRRNSVEAGVRPQSLSHNGTSTSQRELRRSGPSSYFPSSRRGSQAPEAQRPNEDLRNPGVGRLDPPSVMTFQTNTISRHGSIVPQLLETPPELRHLKQPIQEHEYSTSSLDVQESEYQRDSPREFRLGGRRKPNRRHTVDLEAQVRFEDETPTRPQLNHMPATSGGGIGGSHGDGRKYSRGKSYSKAAIREEKRTVVTAEELEKGSLRDSTWLAAVISSDTKLAIFKNFEVLLAECLLYLQDRLSELEEEVWVMNETEAQMKGMNDGYFSEERAKAMKEVADVSKQYFKTLRTYQRVMLSRQPHHRDLKAFNHYRRIAHSHAQKYEPEEVIALVPRPDDVFEKLAAYDSPVMLFGRSYFKHDVLRIPRNPKKIKKPRDWTSTNSRSAKFARFFISFLAPLMTLVPIVALYYIQGDTNRLIGLICFTLAFSALLGISEASNSEVLAGSTGYAAVLVVFVGTGGFQSE
ncbi:hypothetical protein BJ508DRAFT_315526 [Ascobolus immersus RN42]|uniref:DUF6594 domain-containing protein n=1 Tax=Ascobolus immersus RN42 TaxID=1160509 RepID=A0A3N4HEB2_ASCIM|nr:hypothetical protein BJ508DRAFT_315526 [Ascobolus immersus RN42]